jgi:DedD protein
VDILLKQRLTGAVVLISFVVIFIPMLLSSKGETYFAQAKTNIPPLPTYEFSAQSMKMVGENSQPEVEVLSKIDTEVKSTKRQFLQGAVIGPIIRDIQIPQGEIEKNQSTKKQNIPSTDGTATSSVAKINKDKNRPNIAKTNVSKTMVSKTKVSKINVSKSSLSKSTKADSQGWIVQVGSFKIKKNALRLNSNLMAMGYTSFIKPLDGKNGMIYRVRVGPEVSQVQAEVLQGILDKKVKLKGLVMRY